jgi:leucyl aminopeptidase
MAATVLNSPEAVTMSVYVVRAFVQMREQIATNREILKRLAEIDQRAGGVISSLFETGEFAGKAGESAYVHGTGDLKARRLLLLGGGKAEEAGAGLWRKMAGTAARLLRGKKAQSIGFVVGSTDGNAENGAAITEGVLLSLFEPDKYHTTDKTERLLHTTIIAVEGGAVSEVERGIERGRIIAEATNFGREVINEPANILTPTELAHRAWTMANEYGLRIDVIEEQGMKELGMGALLGVAQGSAEPPKLIVLTYTPEKESAETIAIVGKESKQSKSE